MAKTASKLPKQGLLFSPSAAKANTGLLCRTAAAAVALLSEEFHSFLLDIVPTCIPRGRWCTVYEEWMGSNCRVPADAFGRHGQWTSSSSSSSPSSSSPSPFSPTLHCWLYEWSLGEDDFVNVGWVALHTGRFIRLARAFCRSLDFPEATERFLLWKGEVLNLVSLSGPLNKLYSYFLYHIARGNRFIGEILHCFWLLDQSDFVNLISALQNQSWIA